MKTKRYWLRGGLIVLLLSILLFIISLQFQRSTPILHEIGNLSSRIIEPGMILTYPLTEKCLLDNFWNNGYHSCPINPVLWQLMVVGLDVILYFLLGSLFGWFYGKIKKSRDV